MLVVRHPPLPSRNIGTQLSTNTLSWENRHRNSLTFAYFKQQNQTTRPCFGYFGAPERRTSSTPSTTITRPSPAPATITTQVRASDETERPTACRAIY